MKRSPFPFVALQLIAWVIVFLFMVLYSMQKLENWPYGLVQATIYVAFYSITIYSQSHYLLPSYVQKGLYVRYGLFSFFLFVLLVLCRMTTEYVLLYKHFMHHAFYTFTVSHFAFASFTQFLATGIGVLFYIARNYLLLLEKQKQIQAQQLEAELNLLKSQVQPHFLFNTLNNIYYLAHSKSDKTTEMIAKLSALMRYFLDDATQQTVNVKVDLQFISDYIALETIRIPYPLSLTFCISAIPENTYIPPMLLMPLVENVFKHGIDKTNPQSWAKLKLHMEQDKLIFEVRNSISCESLSVPGHGLENLRKRLELIYPNRYNLKTERLADQFEATLCIPITAHP